MKVKVGDITTSCLGKMLDAEKNQGEYEPYLANLNVRWGSFELDNLQMMRFKPEEQERYEVLNGDLIMCEGGEPGRCAIWRSELPNMKIQKALHRIRAKEGTDIGYLYYWFLFAGKNHLIDGYFTGSTIKHLPGDKLKLIEIELPDYESQKRISSVLSSLDEKIANNNAICSNLEAVAKLLYDYWFVQFDFPDENGKPYKSSGGKMVWNVELKREIPAGWEVKRFDELLMFQKGRIPEELLDIEDAEHNSPYITIDVANNGLPQYCSSKGMVPCHGETLMVMDGAASGDVYIGYNGSLGSTLAMLSSKRNDVSDTLIYLMLKSNMPIYKRANVGSTVPHANRSFIEQMKIALPNDAKKYCSELDKIYSKIVECRKENQLLAFLRDFLLPMLMNGQVKVEKVGA